MKEHVLQTDDGQTIVTIAFELNLLELTQFEAFRNAVEIAWAAVPTKYKSTASISPAGLTDRSTRDRILIVSYTRPMTDSENAEQQEFERLKSKYAPRSLPTSTDTF